MTDPAAGLPPTHLARLNRALVALPVAVVVAGGLASALDARSLLVAGAILIGWSQLVGL